MKKYKNTETKGAFRKSKLAGQTGRFENEIQYLAFCRKFC